MKIERGARIFLDTNILLEATDQGRRLHGRAQAVFRDWPVLGLDLYASGQVLREYLMAATRRLMEWARVYGVVGNKLHELNILATLHENGLELLLTLNGADFSKGTGICILPLQHVDAGPTKAVN